MLATNLRWIAISWVFGLCIMTVQSQADSNNVTLFGGTSPGEGVLLFQNQTNGTWDTLCLPTDGIEPNFGYNLCRQLGFKVFCGSASLALMRNSSTYNQIDYPVNSTITPPINCTLDEVVWIVCSNDVELRLEYGIYERKGLLQMRCNNINQWHGMCEGFVQASLFEHEVACRHLGFDDTLSARAYTVPRELVSTEVTGFLEDVTCRGEEANLLQCYFEQSGESCRYYTGLECPNEHEPTLEIRLADLNTEAAGLVQVRKNPTDEWSAICAIQWDLRDAQVVCRHLGYKTGITDTIELTDIDVRTNVLTALGCRGDESKLTECDLINDEDVTCHTRKYAYVECVAEIEQFDVPALLCVDYQSCGFDCNKEPQDEPGDRNKGQCKCDDACAYFNDCCYDYQANCAPSGRDVFIKGIDIGFYRCIWTGSAGSGGQLLHFGHALVGACPETWASSFLREKCEEPIDRFDAIGSLPVYDEEGVVYKNINCAICHGVNPRDLRKWDIQLELLLMGEFTYVPVLNKTVFGTPTGGYFFAEPKGTGGTGSARTCPVDTIISTCTGEFNTTLEQACEDYFAPFKRGRSYYRNPHCAMCNGLDEFPDTVTCGFDCLPDCDHQQVWDRCVGFCVQGGAFSVETLFDFGWGGNDEDLMCQSGELFDPFLERCRAIFCTSGSLSADGKCRDDAAMSEYLGSIQTDNDGRNIPRGDECLVNATLPEDALYWELHPMVEDGSAQDAPSGGLKLYILAKAFDQTLDLKEDIVEFFEIHKIDLELCDIRVVEVFDYQGAILLSNIDDCANSTALFGDVFNTVPNRNASDLQFLVSKSLIWYKQGSDFTKNYLLSQQCLDVIHLNCSQIIFLNGDEFVSRKASMEHTLTGKVFEPDEFVILEDGSAVICGPVHWNSRDHSGLGTVSLVCGCLSITALVATIFTYCVFPVLRNLAGMYTLNLVVALFLANVLLVLAGIVDFRGNYCLSVASLLHFSWLSAFSWMAFIAFNVAKTFHSARVNRAGGGRFVRARLLTSMSCIWGFALVVVAVCVVLTLCDCTTIPPIYTTSPPCWVGDFTALMVVFGVPVASSVLLSTCFFIVVLVSVRKTKSKCQMVQDKGKLKEILEELKICIKLTLLFGITWILAFVSELVNHVVFSYINVVINTLQGVFVFMVLCLNQRVRALWKKNLLSLKSSKDIEQNALSKQSIGTSAVGDTRTSPL